MTTDVGIVVAIKPDDSGARVIKRSLDDINQLSKTANNANRQLEGQIRSTSQATAMLGNAFKGLFAAYGAREIIRAADQYTVMEARIRSIAKTTQETSRVMGELRNISAQTGSEIGTSLSILQRLSFVREEIKATNNDMLAFTETVTKLGVTSGALPEAMKAGLTQLGQALSSQYTRAEEFNSIMENIPAVGKAIADELGVTTGQMRLLVVEGKLLSSDVFAAILNQTEKVRAEFEEFPKTAAQGFSQLTNSLSQIIGQANAATGATNAIGMGLRTAGEAAKAVYDGLATTFDYLVSGIEEGINLVTIAINKMISAINLAKQYIPFADKNPIDTFDTVSPGSIFSAANEARKTRESALFSDPFAGTINPERRAISQDYAKIAAGLNVDKEGQRAAAKEAREAAQEQKRLQNELESAINGSMTAQEKLNAEITHLEKLKGVAKTADQVELLNRGIRNTQAEIDKLNLKTELDSPLVKGFAAVADEIQDGFKDAFKGAFDGGGSLFQKMADGIKATFKSLLLDLAYQAAVRPILVSVLGAGAGALGISSSAQASVLGTSGGTAGTGLGGFSSLSGLLSGGLYSSTLGGIGTGLGNLLSGQSYNFIGPTKFGAIGNGALGNLGYGAIGGLGASLLGLGNKNGMVNLATGTLGSLAGGAIGTSMGTILGMSGGPVGALAGGFLGTALGGLFGGAKPSDMAQGGGLNLSTLNRQYVGGQTGKKFSQQNANFRDSILGEAENLAKLFQSVGGKTSGNLYVTVGNRDGLRVGYGATERNYGNNTAAFTNAVMQEVVKGTTGLNETFTKILGVLGTGNTQTLAQGFEFGKWYQDLGKVADPLADALKSLNEQFDAMKDMATRLGFPLEKINTEYDKQKTALEGSIKAQQAGFSSFEQLTSAFDSFFDGQALSANSSLTPMEKLKTAQSSFGNLLSKAQGGDLSVTPDLLNSANSLLGVGRDVYASGTDFSGLESFVRSSVQGIASQTGYTGQNISYSIVSTNQQLVQGNNTLVQAVQDMKAEIYRLNNKITALVA